MHTCVILMSFSSSLMGTPRGLNSLHILIFETQCVLVLESSMSTHIVDLVCAHTYFQRLRRVFKSSPAEYYHENINVCLHGKFCRTHIEVIMNA